MNHGKRFRQIYRAALAALTLAALAGCGSSQEAHDVSGQSSTSGAVIPEGTGPNVGVQYATEVVQVGGYWVQCVRVHQDYTGAYGEAGGLSCDWNNKVPEGED